MLLTLQRVEAILCSDQRLKLIFDQKYELSFEGINGRQVAVNRRSPSEKIGIWVENTFQPSKISFSSDFEAVHFSSLKPRAHLSAARLRGPYLGQTGNDCWYFTVTSEVDLNKILAESFAYSI